MGSTVRKNRMVKVEFISHSSHSHPNLREQFYNPGFFEWEN